MRNRIEQTIKIFQSLKASGNFSFQANTQVFASAIQLLEELSTKLSSQSRDDISCQYHEIVFGTAIYVLSIDWLKNKDAYIISHNNIYGQDKDSLATFNDKFDELTSTSGLSAEELNQGDWPKKLIPIPIAGRKVLREKILPFNYFGDSVLGKFIAAAIPREQYDEEYRHRQLYLKVYKNQERWHRIRSFAWKTLCILAAILPPLSLIITIKYLLNPSKKLQKGKFISWMLVAAVLPLFSGLFSLVCVNRVIKNYRKKDPIQKTTWSLIDWQNDKKQREKSKASAWPTVKWKKIMNKEKPKKVLVANKEEGTIEVYQDLEQTKKRGKKAIQANKNKSASQIIQIWQGSQAKSVKNVKQLEREYASSFRR